MVWFYMACHHQIWSVIFHRSYEKILIMKFMDYLLAIFHCYVWILLSHIVVKGSRLPKFVAYARSVKVQHSEQSNMDSN